MNNFFLDKVETIRKSMPVSTLDLSKIQESMLYKNCSLDIEDVSLTKIKKVLRGLSNSKSTSLDGLNNYVVKLASEFIASPLHHVISLIDRTEVSK